MTGTKASVRIWTLPDDLAPCLSMFYTAELPLPDGQRVTDYLIPEWANLRFFLRGTPRVFLANGQVVESAHIATGPSSHALRFDADSALFCGFGLHPAGWARTMRAPASTMANAAHPITPDGPFAAFHPLCQMLAGAGHLDADLIETVYRFLRTALPPARTARRIEHVHAIMIDPYLTEVSVFAERAGMSVRTLERLCARYFGFPPRLLLRRQRLMRSLTSFLLVKGGHWSDLIDRHYHDQAHFVREFHAFMGMTPTEYAQAPRPFLQPLMAERQRVWGAPALAPPS